MTLLWIPLTLAAAFLQNVRSALQKHLKGRLTTLGAAYVRFLYALPFSLIYLWGLNTIGPDCEVARSCGGVARSLGIPRHT